MRGPGFGPGNSCEKSRPFVPSPRSDPPRARSVHSTGEGQRLSSAPHHLSSDKKLCHKPKKAVPALKGEGDVTASRRDTVSPLLPRRPRAGPHAPQPRHRLGPPCPGPRRAHPPRDGYERRPPARPPPGRRGPEAPEPPKGLE